MKRKTARIFSELALLALLGLFLIPPSAVSATPKVIKMKHTTYMWKTSAGETLAAWLYDYVEKKSGGRIKISRFYSQSLHKVPEILPAVSNGIAELGLISYGYYPANFPISRGAEWYYRCLHADTLFYVMRDLYAQFAPMREEWEVKNNLKVLFFLNWDYCPFFLTKPCPNIAGLKGRKIRGYGVGADTVERLGGRGVPMVAPEVYTSLQRGILDGVFGYCYINAYEAKLHEVAPYVIEHGAGAHAPIPICMNMDVWKSLDPELKAIFEAGVDELYKHAYVDIYSKMIEKAVDGMVAGGAKFSTWSPDEIAKAKAMVQPGQVNNWIEKVCPLDKSECRRMQALIDKLIAKYEPNSKLKTPWEVYIEKYGK